MIRKAVAVVSIALIFVALSAVLPATMPPAAAAAAAAQAQAPAGPDVRLDAVMGGGIEGYQLADRPRSFVFPKDHGPHPGFRTEWWYLTGHLDGPDGEWFGVQLTFFRFGLRPPPVGALVPGADAGRAGSDWLTREAWMGHLALTDVRGRRFSADERFARGALGLAGATARPFAVWLEDWRLAASADAPDIWHVSAGADGPEGFSIALELDASAPPVLNGQAGLSVKGDQAENASYYYSMPRLPASGQVRTASGEMPVSGTLWLDREWSTSALEPGTAGWDWFALQLDDGRNLMLYQLRQSDGAAHPASAGTLTAANQGSRHLGATDFSVRVTRHWTSPQTGRRYPAGWRIAVSGSEEVLHLLPAVAGQEHTGMFDYWEGAVRVLDGVGQARGRGYVEMTGYQ